MSQYLGFVSYFSEHASTQVVIRDYVTAGLPCPGFHLEGQALAQTESRSSSGEPETHLPLKIKNMNAEHELCWIMSFMTPEISGGVRGRGDRPGCPACPLTVLRQDEVTLWKRAV